jgi:preprotein translocase subunit SecA
VRRAQSANPDNQVAEATLYLKGITLRAKDSSADMKNAINLIADEMAVQVKRHRDKRRGGARLGRCPSRPRSRRCREALTPRDQGRGQPPRPGTLNAMSLLDRALRLGEGKQFKSYAKRVDKINSWEPELELLDDDELRGHADRLRERARNGEPLEDLLPETFAVVGRPPARHGHAPLRRAAHRRHGPARRHDRRDEDGRGQDPHGHPGRRPQRARRRGVHVVTVNDYLARRDAEWMSPIYDFLGLTWGVLQNMQPARTSARPTRPDITYGTNSEFGFDYLRDNMATSLDEKVQHGGRYTEDGKVLATHNFAIVDEVDNILIDEARTPLIISGAPEQAGELYAKFAKLAPHMEAGKKPEGWTRGRRRSSSPTTTSSSTRSTRPSRSPSAGVEKAERFLGIDHLYRAENGHLVNHLIQSLKAQSLYKRDVDYAVVDGQVQIIDEFTGRILEGRRWSEGLHQAIEAKEGVRVQEENQTLATITLQNYFRMYDKLAGMTGTALTEATEFMKIYKLPVVQIPTNRPDGPRDQNDQVFKTQDGKWARWSARSRRATSGQPVLVGTISVEVSELLGQRSRRGIPHTVLNAKPGVRRARGRDRRRGRPARARSRSPPTWPAAASTSSSAATRST